MSLHLTSTFTNSMKFDWHFQVTLVLDNSQFISFGQWLHGNDSKKVNICIIFFVIATKKRTKLEVVRDFYKPKCKNIRLKTTQSCSIHSVRSIRSQCFVCVDYKSMHCSSPSMCNYYFMRDHSEHKRKYLQHYAKSAQPNKLLAMLEVLQIPLEGELYRLQHYTSTQLITHPTMGFFPLAVFYFQFLQDLAYTQFNHNKSIPQGPRTLGNTRTSK